jgi:hypothetical protein
MIVRLRSNLIEEMMHVFTSEKQKVFIKYLSEYLERDLEILSIDNVLHLLTFEVIETMVIDTMNFETHYPDSNMMRIGDEDIQVFDIID